MPPKKKSMNPAGKKKKVAKSVTPSSGKKKAVAPAVNNPSATGPAAKAAQNPATALPNQVAAASKLQEIITKVVHQVLAESLPSFLLPILQDTKENGEVFEKTIITPVLKNKNSETYLRIKDMIQREVAAEVKRVMGTGGAAKKKAK